MRNVEFKVEKKLGGRYLLEAVNVKTGRKRVLADWFDNLILTQGLNRLGTGSAGNFAHVGAGSTAPVIGNTAMQTPVATSSTLQEALNGSAASAPYYGWARKRMRFAPGVATGNLSEVGFGWGTGSNLFSRSLIKDAEGDPTTITVLADEYLDVTYELRNYAPTVDVETVINIAGVDYTFTMRAASANASPWQPHAVLDYGMVNSPYVPACHSRSGPIGTIIQTPSGSGPSGSEGTVSFFAYSNNSLKRTMRFSAGLNDANVAGGIGAFRLFHQPLGDFQFGISPKIPKDSTKVLTIDFEISWAAYTP